MMSFQGNRTVLAIGVVAAAVGIPLLYVLYTAASERSEPSVDFGVRDAPEADPVGEYEPADRPERGELSAASDDGVRYRSESYGFSFTLPPGFTVGEFDESGGRVVLAQSASGEGAFQVYITGWDDPAEALTPERIRRDLPDLEMSNLDRLSMDGGERHALTFVSEDPSFGRTREVWFIYDRHLYQVMTYVEAQDFLAEVLKGWRFD